MLGGRFRVRVRVRVRARLEVAALPTGILDDLESTFEGLDERLLVTWLELGSGLRLGFRVRVRVRLRVRGRVRVRRTLGELDVEADALESRVLDLGRLGLGG